MNVNLCGTGLRGFVNVDISLKADYIRDLEWMRVPFKKESVDKMIFMSAINYFTYDRAKFLVKDIYRVLKKGGVVRIGVQDLELIARNYLNREWDCMRVNRWFGNVDGYKSNFKRSKFVWDYATLREILIPCGYSWIYSMPFGESNYGLGEHDNREEQMFFIEAVK